MKLLTLIASVLLSITIQAQTLDSIKLEGTSLLYHKIETQTHPKKGVLIFMHGGVSQLKELSQPMEISPEAITEGNQDFLPFIQALGYDVILPIAFNEYNWMEDGGHQFILALAEKHRPFDGKVILSGFSDGGTGAYQIFYLHPKQFDAVLIFNGYPQHHNFYKKVDYTLFRYKPILFASTKNDKRIPYEFLLKEYRRQKITNPNTYFYLTEGGHSFADYKLSDFEKCFAAIEKPELLTPASNSISIYPPIDGWMDGNNLEEVYPFRKKAVKKYGMAKSEYARDDYDFRELSRLLEKGPITIRPSQITEQDLQSKQKLKFIMQAGNESREIELNNWLIMDSWK